MNKSILFSFVFLFSFTTGAMTVDKQKITFEEFKDYEFCHKQKYPSAYCEKALKVWLKDHPKDTLKAALVTRQHMNSWTAVPLFVAAKNSEEFDCESKDLFLAIKSAYKLPKRDKKIIEMAQTLTFDKCSSVMPKKIAKTISFKQENYSLICKRFLAKGLLKGLKKAKCK